MTLDNGGSPLRDAPGDGAQQEKVRSEDTNGIGDAADTVAKLGSALYSGDEGAAAENGPQRDDVDAKAAARARRKALRDARLANSVEAPRMVDYEGESARFFGGDPSSRDLIATISGDDDVVRSTGGTEDVKSARSDVDDGGASKNNQEGGDKGDAKAEGQKDEGCKILPDPIDDKAAAKAKRKAFRDARLSNSVEAPRVFGYGGESERFFGDNPSSRDLGATVSDQDNAVDANNMSGDGGPTNTETRGVGDRVKASGEEGARSDEQEICATDNIRKDHGVSPGLDDLQKGSSHHASEISLGLEDLMKSDRSQLSLSDISLDEEEERNRADFIAEHRGRSPLHLDSLHSSLMPRKKSAREDANLLRSLSTGSGLTGASLELTRNRSVRLDLLQGEPKRKPKTRTRRTPVARLNDGQLDASMNSSKLKSSALAASLTLPGKRSSLTSSGKSALSDSAQSGMNVDKHVKSRRATTDCAPPAKTRRAIDTPPESRRNSIGSVPESRGMSFKNHHYEEPELIEVRGRSDRESLDESAHSNRTPLDESARSKRTPLDESATNSGPRLVPPVEVEEGEGMRDEEYQLQPKLPQWAMIRRYRRTSSNSIEMLESQFFIPPPEEGGSLCEVLFYTLHGYGNDFVVWIYQASFFKVLALFFIGYYALVFSFAGILVSAESRNGGRCGLDVYQTFSNSDSYFELAFELSWSTFTTVGYGKISPSGEETGCYSIRFACSLFAFMGLLYNSLSAAIFFSKLERVLTRASVSFSSSACLQFGKAASYTRGSKGVYGQFWMKNNSMRSLVTEGSKSNRSMSTVGSDSTTSGRDSAHDAAKARRHVPFPFLEFRLVNDHANYKNRAVRNARVTAMVQLSGREAENARSLSGKRAASAGTFREDVAVASSHTRKDSLSSSQNSDLNPCSPPQSAARARRGALTESIIATAFVVQESDSGAGKGSTPEGRVYYPLKLEPDEHPYFGRVWYIRHTLNEKSPLLKSHVREKIKTTGSWDHNSQGYQDILDSLVDFHRIRITFKGISAVSNAMVFAQKLYTIEDVYVGYQFGQIFYEKEHWAQKWLRRLWPFTTKQTEGEEDQGDDDKLMLDKRLIHDIIPQQGGGAEPIEG